MFNQKILKTAIVAALATGANGAMAYLPTGNIDGDFLTYWAGASASSQSAQESVIDFVCDSSAGTVNLFTRASAWAVACNATAAKTPALGTGRVLVVKRDGGGSGVGVGPVQQAIALNFMDVSTTNCTGAVAAKTSSNGTVYDEKTCGSTNFVRVPDIGSSDIEPALFTGLNAPVLSSGDTPFPGAYPFNPTGAAYSKTAVLGDLVFNTPVTLDLYQALQAAQFAAASVCHPSNVGYGTVVSVNIDDPSTALVNEAINAPNGETEKCMPSLTKEEITSILTGQTKNWNEFKILSPTQTGGTTTDLVTNATAAGLVVPPGGATVPVQICRRVAGSGTQAQNNVQWLAINCAVGVVQPKTATTLTRPFVAENSSSTNVEQCLDDYNDGSNVSLKNSTSTKRWAIGIRSTEASSSTLAVSPFTSFNYRFIKVDGIAPTIENVHRGDYWNFATSNLQAAPLAGAAALATFDVIATSAFTVNGLKTLNNDCKHGFGRGCWLGTPKASPAPQSPTVFDVDDFTANPINSWTRAPNNAPLNTCQPIVKSEFAPQFIGAPVPTFP